MAEFEVTSFVREEVVAAARSLLAFIDGTPPVADVLTVALYVLQQKASEFKHPTQDAGKQPTKIDVGNMTACPLCEEVAPSYFTQLWFPGTCGYRCSQGHTWQHDLNP
jgi:hypothetical protein